MDKLLFSSTNPFYIQQVCQVLTENNIPFIKKELGGGDYLNITMGLSFQGSKIYVSNENFDTAMNLIDFLVEEKEVNNTEDNKDDDFSRATRRQKHLSRLMFFYCIGFPILVIIILFIFAT